MMNKILFFLVFVSGSLFAQNDEAKVAPSYNKMMIGVSFSPDYAYRTLSSDGTSVFSNYIIESRNKRETAKLGYTFGLNFNYNFSRKFGLITGVLYSNKGYQTESIGNLTFGDQIHSRRGFVILDPNDPAIPNSFKSVYNHYYLDVPLKAIYRMGKGKIRFISSVGIITHILMKSTVKTISEYQNGEKEKSTRVAYDNYKKINLSPTISLGVEKQFNNQSLIRVEPTFNYGLLDIIDTPVRAKLWNVGLNVSYYLRLK